MIRELEFLVPLAVTLLSQHRLEEPYGVDGGEPGQRGEQRLTWPDGKEEEMPGIFGAEVKPGTILRIATPGGGGAGSGIMPES